MAERHVPNRRRIMREFTIKELGAVDRPAQGPALAVLMKRSEAMDDAAPPLAVAIVKRYLDPADGAYTFAEVLAENLKNEKYYEANKEISPAISALDCALRSIAGDSDLGASDKQRRMEASVGAFLQTTQQYWPGVESALQDTVNKFQTGNGDKPMTDADKKQIVDLQKNVEDLTKKLEAATAKEPTKKAADLAGELDAAKAQIDELTKKAASEKSEKEEAVAKAGMSDAEKAHMGKLSGADKMKFMQAAPADRAKMMAKAAEGDEVVKVGDREIRKSVVGEDQFAVIKSQQEEISKQNERIAKAEETRDNAELAKRADEEPYKHFSVDKAATGAKAATKVDVMRAIAKMDGGARAVLEKWLDIGAKAVASAFDKIGHSHEQTMKSAGDFDKRVVEVMSRDKVSRLVAMEKAQREFPDEFRALQDSGARVN